MGSSTRPLGLGFSGNSSSLFKLREPTTGQPGQTREENQPLASCSSGEMDLPISRFKDTPSSASGQRNTLAMDFNLDTTDVNQGVLSPTDGLSGSHLKSSDTPRPTYPSQNGLHFADDPLHRCEKQREKNRNAQRRFREKQKVTVATLELKVEGLVKQMNRLRRERDAVAQQNMALQTQLVYMEQLLKQLDVTNNSPVSSAHDRGTGQEGSSDIVDVTGFTSG